MLFGCLQRFTPTRHQEKKEQQQHRPATHQPKQHRACQQILDFSLRAWRCSAFNRAWRDCGSGYTLKRRGYIRFRRVRRLGDDLCRYRRRQVGRQRFFGLKLGQLIILQHDQTLKLVQLALQIFHPALQLGIFTATGVQPLLGHCQLVAHIAGVPCNTLACRLARLARHQAQTVPRHSLGRRCRFRLATGCIQLLSQRHRATAIAPIGILRGHFVDSLGLGQLDALTRVRQAQHLTGFKAVDIAVDEGIRVQGLNRQHGLLHRAAIACLGRDFPQGVTGRCRVMRWLRRVRRRG